MANCEYQLGQLKEALEHYQAYVHAATRGTPTRRARNGAEPLETARMRIEAINRRESDIAINTSPPGADVLIEGPRRVTGQAPNTFRIPRGHYQVTISKKD